MKYRYMMILLIVMALFDDLLSLRFPVDFQFQGYSFIPHFCFVTLMLLVYDKAWLDRVLISGLCGILIDILFMQTLPVYFLLYSCFGYMAGIFSKTMEEDPRVRFFVILILTFLLDAIPTCFNIFASLMNVSLVNWFVHHELLTLALHSIFIVLMIYVFDVWQRFTMIRSKRRQKEDYNFFEM